MFQLRLFHTGNRSQLTVARFLLIWVSLHSDNDIYFQFVYYLLRFIIRIEHCIRIHTNWRTCIAVFPQTQRKQKLQKDTCICEEKKTTQEKEWESMVKPGMGYKLSRVYKENIIMHCGGDQS